MVRVIGAALCGAAAAGAGFAQSGALQRRLRAVGDLRDVLLAMEQQIAFYSLPLPQLFRELDGALNGFFAQAAAELEQNRGETAEAVLNRCLTAAELGLPEEAETAFRRLLASLGRLDGTSQTERVRRAVAQLDGLERELREEARRRGKCWKAAGVCGGLTLTILLL